MIPRMNIIAWGNIVPWADLRQVEQDLVISRALVELFSNPGLAGQLRFRGGTALNKLHFPQPLRYSEDIDLVRTETGPIGPVLDAIREALEPWLGRAGFAPSATAPKLRFRVDADDPSAGAPIRLKVEINTQETEAFDPPLFVPFAVENPWFSGAVDIPTFSPEEILATKLRALLQRNKGRDLFDLHHGLRTFEGLDRARVVRGLMFYLEASGLRISRAEAQRRMFAKLANPAFLTDMRPLVSVEHAGKLDEDSTKEAFRQVLRELVDLIPGENWAQTPKMLDRFAI
ncbi:MAG: nucleotidyl transferase AbiEii/AbiGii toxin family protein [Nitrospinae bacterium]|nr:nucleotidyl transferase AbiEii/AbiGii toxin family protein [Nitrospinota bacterium]